MLTPVGPSCGRSLCTHLGLHMVHSVPIHILTHVVHSINNVSSYVTTHIIIFHHCRGNPLATHQIKNLQCKAIRSDTVTADCNGRITRPEISFCHDVCILWDELDCGVVSLCFVLFYFLFFCSNIRLPNVKLHTCCSSPGCTVICAATSHYMVFI